MKKLFALSLMLLVLSGCVRLNTLSLTEIPVERDEPIQAEASEWVIFGLVFDNDFVDKVPNQLKLRCQGGKIKGVLSKYAYVNYFFGIVMKREVQANAYCVRS